MVGEKYLNRPSLLLLLIFIVYLPLYFYRANDPILDTYSFRQTQTATIARNFYRHGINLWKTELDIFGPGEEKYFVLEFPLYQATVAIIYKIFGVNPAWGRIVSIFMGYSGAVFLFLLMRMYTRDLSLSCLTIFVYLGIPINLHFNRTFIMDPMVVTLTLAFLYFFSAAVLTNSLLLWVMGLITASLSFLHKGIYGPFFLLPVVYLCFSERHRLKNWWLLILSFSLPLALLFLWYLHAAGINLATGHGDHTLGDPAYRIWNFGLWKDRFSWQMWQPRLINLYPEFLTPVTVIPSAVGLFRLTELKNREFFIMLLSSSLIYFVTIFRLQDCHYYQLLITPIAAVLCAHGLVTLGSFFPNRKQRNFFLTLFTLLFLASSIPLAYRYRFFQPEVLEVAEFVKSHTHPEEAVIYCLPEYDWNSQYVYYSERKGIVLESCALQAARINSLKRKGYGLIVLLDWQKYLDLNKKHRFLQGLPLLKETFFYRIYSLRNE